MERESFEDSETAELLNKHFVPVKVPYGCHTLRYTLQNSRYGRLDAYHQFVDVVAEMLLKPCFGQPQCT
jgi:hypothetical protein